MKTYLGFILLTFFYISPLFAQKNNLVTIKWSENIVKFSENGDSKEFLYFENAIFEDESFLPFYYKLIDISLQANEGYEYEIELKNMVFEPFSKSEIEKIEHLDKIQNTVSVESNQYFSARKLYIQFTFIPIKRNEWNGEFEKLVSFEYQYIRKAKKTNKVKNTTKYAQNSVLKTGDWYKIAINKTGIYKLTFDQLRSLGISNPQNVRVFGNGGDLLPTMNDKSRIDDLKELKIQTFSDYILFYAKAPTKWYYDFSSQMFLPVLHKFSQNSYYFLTSDYASGFSNQIENQSLISESAQQTVTKFIDYYHYEKELENLIESGSTWYGEKFDMELERDFNVNFPNIVSASQVKFKISLLARAFSVSSFNVNVDGFSASTSIPATSVSETAPYAQVSTKIFQFPSSGNNAMNLNLKYLKSSSSNEGWLDYFIFNVERDLVFSGNQMNFRYINSSLSLKTVEFIVGNMASNVKIWDVSDIHNVENMALELNGGKAYFKQSDSTHLEFIAFNESGYLTPITQGEGLGKVENQNLHALPQTDYIIIYHPKFYTQAQELKSYYEQTTDLHITLVKPEQIYNEFSSGAPDVSALRDFVRMFYKRYETQGKYPRYLLLFGNGSFDNAGYVAGYENSNYILTYQSENSVSPTSSFVSDDFFGLLDDDEGDYYGLLDIGIGRFPVETVEQAQLLVNKTKNYNSSNSFGNWHNNLTFIADDGDDNNGNIHLNHGEGLSEKVRSMHPEYNITKLYLGAFNQESTAGSEVVSGVNIGIADAMSKGTLVFNYNGHGNEYTLAHEKIIDLNIIRSWTNYNRLPVFMTATCEFSRFDAWEIFTAGEEILLHPNGGSIAMFSTTRLVYASPNYTLNSKFYDYIFENDTNNQQYRLGEVMRFTKINSGSGINKRNFTLLGDPALQIFIPKNKIIVTAINGKNVGQDTLKAAAEVTVSGEILDANNLKKSDFNGTLNLIVFDKYTTQQTLGQDDAAIVDFEIQKNILYNGLASVKNGEFSISFIVPKDISYKIGKGKLSFYAQSTETVASGYNNLIDIGGFSENPVSGDQQIDLKIFMNDTTFVSGGITNQNPRLVAFIHSNTGVNMGNGIGHDIMATIDNDTRNSFVLNDFYQAEKDTYKKGKLEYPFVNLEAGNHTLSLKVWDVLNNSTTQTIDFLVVEQKELSIDKLFNYPNPFTQNTWFYFTHNQANSQMEVQIQIFSVSGKLVKTIEKTINVDSYLSEGIFWDGLDDFGDKIGRGVYFYKIKVRNENDEVEKIEKLLILK